MTFNHKTIEELHDLLVKKEISAVELTQATLADIKEREVAVDSFRLDGCLHQILHGYGE